MNIEQVKLKSMKNILEIENSLKEGYGKFYLGTIRKSEVSITSHIQIATLNGVIRTCDLTVTKIGNEPVSYFVIYN